MGILNELLAKGYLPVQLPPAFSSQTFASELSKFEAVWVANGGKEPTRPERYSVARSSFYRRATAIVNPIGFYFLAKDIDTYWPEIETHYKQSPLSRSIPTLPGKLRAIKLKKFSELHEEKVTSSAGFQYALITDIGSFFPTIYTHTIPWALHTKPIAKNNRKRIPKYFGNILDARSQGIQDGQTIGLPIGPDTSHIIAEVIAVAIDQQLTIELGKVPDGFRYVDDFFLFFNRREDAEKALAAVTRSVASFQLQLNPAKTRILEVKELTAESWKYSIKKMGISETRKAQRTDLHHYFESLFLLEKQFKDESLVKYGLKQISSKIIKKSNWVVFEAYLLKCGFSFPNTLQVIAHLLSTYDRYGYPINTQAVSRFCNTVIRSAAAVDHHGEVSWLLWICKELKLDFEADVVEAVQKMASPVCTMILLDLCNAGVVTSVPDESALTQYAAAEALQGPDWLLAYEGGRREWLGITNDSFVASHEYFGPLNQAGVEFYQEEAKLPAIFELKDPNVAPGNVDFDTDGAIEGLFSFDDLDEEYFDSADEKGVDPQDPDNDDPGGSDDDSEGEEDF